MTVIDLSTFKTPAAVDQGTSASDEIDPRVDLLPALLDAIESITVVYNASKIHDAPPLYDPDAVDTVITLLPMLIEDHDLGWALFSELRDMVLGGAQLADGSAG